MSEQGIYDVVINGYGPVGATLANLLAQQGLSVAIADREGGYYHLARAGHFDAEIMRIWQTLGMAEAVEAETGTTVGMRFMGANGELLMEWKRGGAKGPYGWVSDYMFYQPALEKRLRERLAQESKVDAHLFFDAYAIEEHGDHVVLKGENTASSQLVELRGRYLVGCDGARSLVRRVMGTAQEDLGFRQRWLVVDVQQNRDLGLPRYTTQHCNPDRPTTAAPGALGMHRWEMMLKDGESAAEMTKPEKIWSLIGQSVRPIQPTDGEIARATVYTFESLIADRWRQGRLLIAGDAAHRMPPFLGQGMCAGVRDAYNLAWKLAAVCQGRAGDELLDSYESERRPHLRAFTQGAIDAGRLVQLSDEAVRELIVQMQANPKAYAPPNPTLGPGLQQASAHPLIGRQVMQPSIDGRLLDEHLGLGFGLVAGRGFWPSEEALQQSIAAHPHLAHVTFDIEGATQVDGRPWALVVRPDRYVMAAVDAFDKLDDALARASTLIA
jgi:3-(3-hydroxy-phenyl)propionate hydroxylase